MVWLGEYDGYAILEAPDNVSAAGAVLAIAAGSALASVETTVLVTVEETLEALGKSRASTIAHQANDHGGLSATVSSLPARKPSRSNDRSRDVKWKRGWQLATDWSR